MIIEGLLELIYGLLNTLLVFKIPSLPQDIKAYIVSMFDYIEAGVGIVANYTNIEYLLVLFGLVISVDVGIHVYHFVMWVLKKIPMLGIK